MFCYMIYLSSCKFIIKILSCSAVIFFVNQLVFVVMMRGVAETTDSNSKASFEFMHCKKKKTQLRFPGLTKYFTFRKHKN